ncbi:hypothetical protein SEA_TRES_41 [Mycobacterium phage Tres]|uniref:Uncharacterized protein n=5 Tax=Rosebushvirus TaxID=1982900 RepID=A0A0M5M1B0_9CAUD|nr:hypothetical protein FDI79_gp41 [Mycobacterium phage Godines]ALF01326.1 hypothetical protein SEA_TRES_41 [Mycobacterium phage Tres]AUX82249.1 hypothetical protein SEA_ITSYBITSY1_41 [Mycobacterium phage ItsyBitsy1]AXQ52518.1 hypothetical protein SEA_FRENCHFRY_41 [Mycobacterium phage FrenchFry]QFG13995.1 hypothetical protein SEA_RHINOFORTE_41 [Mycobacterium phage Rhinoforte]QYC54285.1 hypothetical protein SEA_ALLEGRO_41 [Mycobacterium phage Allegro]
MGHGAPYTAVISLSVMAAHHWRTIRTRLLNNGIGNLMQLTSMHALLDAVEAIVLEAIVADAVKPEQAKHKRDQFLDALYAPTTPEAKKLNGDGYKPPPSEFAVPEQVEADFDAFARMVAGR